MHQKMAAARLRMRMMSHPSLSKADNHDCCICGANLSLPLTPPSADVCFCVNNVRWNNRETMSRRDYQASPREEKLVTKFGASKVDKTEVSYEKNDCGRISDAKEGKIER